MAIPWLVVGLGNPGPTYATTRHNIGYLAVDEIAAQAHEIFRRPKGVRAQVVETRLSALGWGIAQSECARVVLMKSNSYMNESGGPVSEVLKHIHSDLSHLIVIHDELDLELGRTKIKQGGGDNGHNGLKSIRAHLKSGDFYRVRLGIGRPPGHQPTADYVLGRFTKAENADLAMVVDRSADIVESLINKGLSLTQNTFNS